MVEKYVIELDNANFISNLEQVSSIDVEVMDTNHFSDASFFSEKSAEETIKDMKSKNGEWVFHGECVNPLRARKVTMWIE